MQAEKVKLALIVAMSDNRVIGNKNQLPWRLSGDLRYFKSTTMGKPIIMGRKTYDSIGRLLPGRANIIVTRNAHFAVDGAIVVNTLEAAIGQARAIAEHDDVDEVMCIGGAQLYHEILPYIDRLYLTAVHAKIEGDAFFPELKVGHWQERKHESYKADSENDYDYTFIVMDRL